MKNYDEVARRIFPFDVYADVIPHANHVFCQCKDKMYDLKQENGEVLRKDISEALRSAYQDGVEASARVVEEAEKKKWTGLWTERRIMSLADIANEIRKLKNEK